MPFGLSDTKATLTMDAGGFVSGVQQAAASLDALESSGARAAQSGASVETHLRSAADAMSAAAERGGSCEQSLSRAAAAAGTAAAKADEMAVKTEAARQAMNAAGQSAAESAARLNELQEALEIDSDNITQLEAELEALRQSSGASQTEITELERALEELRTDAAALESEIGRETQSVEKSGNAAELAAAKYNKYVNQLRQAQSAADAANAKVGALAQSMEQSDLSTLSSGLSTWGTSTLTSASRSLSSIAVSAAGLASGTVESTLAARGLSAAMRMVTQAAGPYGLAISGAAALATAGVKKLAESWSEAHDMAGAMQALIDSAADNSYTAALKNVDLSLDEAGIQTQINEKLQHCFDTLTDGKADTPEIVTGLHADIDEEYAGIRAQVSQYFTEAIEGTETEEAKNALLNKEQEILDSLDATQDAANALVDSYAGKSTEVCRGAEEEINEIQQRVNELIESLNTAKALLDSQYGDSYAKVSGGYYATQQDIEWSLTYIQADRTNAEAQAKEAYETAMAALNEAFKGRDGSEHLDVEYSYGGVDFKISGTFDELTHQIEDEYQGSLDTAQNEMLARWNRMLKGLAKSGSMGGEATQAFTALADAVDAHAVIAGIAERFSDGSFDMAELNNLGADFWEKLASSMGLDSAEAQSAFENTLAISPALALAMLGAWDDSLSEAITGGVNVLEGSGFGDLFAAAMESGLFEGIENLNMEDTLTRMQALVGDLNTDESIPVPVSITADPEADPFEMPIAQDTPIQMPVEAEITLPSPEELAALYGDETILSFRAEPEADPFEMPIAEDTPIQMPVEAEITLPSPEELAALNGVADEFSSAGDNAGSAFVSALRGHISAAASTGAAIAAAALSAMKAKLNIHSPSRETYKLGLYTGEGFSMGIRERAQMAKDSMRSMANAALTGAKSARSIDNSRSVTINLNNATIRSEEDVRKLSRALGRYMNDANYGVN